MEFLQGKKTYFVAAAALLAVLGAFASGEITLAEAINQALMAVGLATLRAGVAKAE